MIAPRFIFSKNSPTGVEFSGEFQDFLNRDLAKFYPRLVDLVSFKIVQAGATVRRAGLWWRRGWAGLDASVDRLVIA